MENNLLFAEIKDSGLQFIKDSLEKHYGGNLSTLDYFPQLKSLYQLEYAVSSTQDSENSVSEQKLKVELKARPVSLPVFDRTGTLHSLALPEDASQTDWVSLCGKKTKISLDTLPSPPVIVEMTPLQAPLLALAFLADTEIRFYSKKPPELWRDSECVGHIQALFSSSFTGREVQQNRGWLYFLTFEGNLVRVSRNNIEQTLKQPKPVEIIPQKIEEKVLLFSIMKSTKNQDSYFFLDESFTLKDNQSHSLQMDKNQNVTLTSNSLMNLSVLEGKNALILLWFNPVAQKNNLVLTSLDLQPWDSICLESKGGNKIKSICLPEASRGSHSQQTCPGPTYLLSLREDFAVDIISVYHQKIRFAKTLFDVTDRKHKSLNFAGCIATSPAVDLFYVAGEDWLKTLKVIKL